MEIKYTEPKIIRMDVKNDFLKKRIQPLGNLTITPTLRYVKRQRLAGGRTVRQAHCS